MAIRKESSARLIRANRPYESFSREILQSITNPTALAIYCYLMSKPADWVVRRQEIINHFDGLGRDRYDAAMAYLKDAGLVWLAVIRGPGGQFIERRIVVEGEPAAGKPTIRENLPEGKPAGGFPSRRENRPITETESITETEIDTETEKNTLPGKPGGVDSTIIEDQFEAFYSAYPKKVGKADAEKAWKRLKPSPALIATIMDDIVRRVEQGHWCTGAGKQFIPGPAPYLNQKRWNDEIIPRPDFKKPVDFSELSRNTVDLLQ